MKIELEKHEKKVRVGEEEVTITELRIVDLNRLKQLLNDSEPLEEQLVRMGYSKEHIEKIKQALGKV